MKEEKIRRVTEVYRQLFKELEVDIDPETPERVARMMVNELLQGYNNIDFRITTFDNPNYDQLKAELDIPFYSLCEHHCLPFFGKVHIGYLPDKRIVGLSKLDRIVKHFSRRLQIQERMTQEIADYIMKVIEPKGCMVVIEARHLCKEMRGAEREGAVLVTSAVRGEFLKNSSLKAEFLDLLKLRLRR